MILSSPTASRAQFLPARIEAVARRIETSARRSGRPPEAVQLVAVTKTLPWPLIQGAWECGLRHFGENRPEALAERLGTSQLQLPDLRWHLIGTIQSRKIRHIPGDVALVHSVDRLRIGVRLARLGEQAGRSIPILIQVNPSGEAAKHGVSLADAEALAQELGALPNLEVQGLMAMMPFQADEATLRRLCTAMRRKLDDLRQALPGLPWQHLSMGMSQDFEIAIEEGATIVRVGTAIFGHRPRA